MMIFQTVQELQRCLFVNKHAHPLTRTLLKTYYLARSQSTNFGKDTICCSVKKPFGLVDRALELVGAHNMYTKITDFINSVKLSTVQRMYTGAQFITSRTYTQTRRFFNVNVPYQLTRIPTHKPITVSGAL